GIRDFHVTGVQTCALPILQSGYRRAKLSWYTIDQVFHSSSLRPNGITDTDVSSNRTRRIYKSELYPNMDIAAGELTIVNTLDLRSEERRVGKECKYGR